MNLFRSEEHARNWRGYRPDAEGGLLPLEAMMTIFSAEYFRQRLSQTYISDLGNLRGTLLDAIQQVTGGDPFWSLSAP